MRRERLPKGTGTLNETNPAPADPPPAVVTPLASLAHIDDLRAAAGAAPWPRNRLYQLQADVLAANRAAHEAQVGGDPTALAAAILRRAEAAGRLDAERDRLAELFLVLLSTAADRRPVELAELLDSLPTLAGLAERVADLEAVVAEGVV